MKVIISGVITRLKRSETNGVDYFTLEEGNSTINLSGGENDCSKLPLLQPVVITGTIEGGVYNGKQSLKLLDFTVTKG